MTDETFQPKTPGELQEYLDKAIRAWRENFKARAPQDPGQLMAMCYIDAFQCVRKFFFGSTLEPE